MDDYVHSTVDNGWCQWCDSVEVFLADGDHDSILRAEKLGVHADTFEGLVNEVLASSPNA